MRLIGSSNVVKQRMFALTSVSFLVIFLLFISPVHAVPLGHDHSRQINPPENLPAGATPSIVKAIMKDLPPEYHLQAEGDIYSMSNPSHGIQIQFFSTGPQITSGNSDWQMTMSGIGRQGNVRPVQPAQLVNDDGRMVYDRGSVSEWYMNSTWGIEQGFTIRRAPEKGEGNLVVELEISGDVEAELRSNTLLLNDLSGKNIAQYTGLQVFDADNKFLTSHLALAGNILSIVVDDYTAEYPITIDPWIQQAKLTASDGTAGDFFGGSVSISGDTIVVGAAGDDDNGDRSGSAYIFEKPVEGWTNITEVAKLTPSDPKVQGYFGRSVAISGDTIVVGAYENDGNVTSSGAAYVFQKPVDGWATMTETAKLTSSDGESPDDFGISVAIDGDTIVVGAFRHNYSTLSGAAYVFQKPVDGWATMTETAKLTAGDTLYFGKSVSINGDTVIVSTYLVDNAGNGSVFNPGAAYVFEKSLDGWVSMTGTVKLTASDSAYNDNFGSSLSISDGTIVIGASLTDALDAGGYNADDSGSAYIFERPASGWTTMTETAKLTASDRARNDQFGSSVFVNGDTIVVGAHYDDDIATDSGSAYVFKKPLTGWTNMTESGKIIANDGAYRNHFGDSVSVSGEEIVVGAGGDQSSIPGSAYVSLIKPIASASVGSFGTLDSGTPSPQTVEYYSTTQFTFNADAGYHVATISGCGVDFTNTDDSLTSKAVTTGTIMGDCTVEATFAINLNTIVAYAELNGSLDPTTPSPQTINYGELVQFTFNADPGYHIESILGCGINFFGNNDQSIVSKTVLTDPFTESCAVYATFGINLYTVSATAGTGGIVSPFWPQAIAYGEAAQFTFSAYTNYHVASISGCGVDFINTDETLVNKTVTTDPVINDCTISATYVAHQHTVNAIAGGNGSLDASTPSPQTVNLNETVQFTFNAVPEYHVATITGCGIDFTNTDEAVVSKAVTTDPVLGDCTVTSTFAINQNTVIATAAANGSLDPSTPSPQTVNSGETVQFIFNADVGAHITSITGCGIDFTNTDYAVTSKTVTTDPFTGSCIVSATFAINQYTVAASAGVKGVLDATTPSPQIINYGETTQFTFNANAGHHIASITGCGIDFTNTDETIASKTLPTDPVLSDCTVSATFAINQNTVIAIAGDNGTLDPATPSPQTVNDGEIAQFTFNADANYHVASISGCGVGFTNTNKAIISKTITTASFTQSCIINASFVANRPTVNAIAGSNGSLDASTPSPQTINPGETTQFIFNAGIGYHVASITGCGIDFTNTDEAVVNKAVTTDPVLSDCTVSASFAINQNTVIATAAANGSLDPSTASPQTVNSGETVQFIFNADVGAHITSITGCGIFFTNTDYAITSKTVTTDPFTESCTVNASFAINQYTVAASAGVNGVLDATTPSPQILSYDETTQFTFNANVGHHIESITGCGIDFTNTDETIVSKTVTTDQIVNDCAVSASFAINQNTVIAIAGENGTLDPATPSPQTVNVGETAQFTFNADANYHVASISGCGVDFTNTDETVTSKTVTTGPYTSSCIVTAAFALNQNTVVAIAGSNGRLDSATPSPQLVLNQGEITQFNFVADPGYHLSSINGCGISYNNTENHVVSKTVFTEPFTTNCAVFAEFAINQYTVTGFVFPSYANGSLDDGTPSPQTVNYGETVQFTFKADVGHYIAYITSYGHITPPCGVSYNNTEDYSVTTKTVSTDPIIDDCSVRGGFWAIQYTATASAGLHGTLDVTTSSPQTVSYGESAQFGFTADPGYHIASINGCGIDFINTDETIGSQTVATDPFPLADDNCIVTSTFAINLNTVIATAGANGSLDSSTPSPQTVNSGETVQFIFNADVGAHITSITGCGIDFTNTDYAITTKTVTTDLFTSSCTVSASFAINQYTVSASAGVNGVLDATTPSPQILSYGERTQFTFNANAGHHIESITGCGLNFTGNTDDTVVSNTITTDPIMSDCTVSAVFVDKSVATESTISFEGFSIGNYHTGFGESGYNMSFIFGIITDGLSYISDAVFNETQFLVKRNYLDPLIIEQVNGKSFNLISFDFAEGNSVFYPANIDVVGTLRDGSTVTETFTLDGFYDGSGPTNDFQTAILPESFKNLVSVEFLWNGQYADFHSIDNIAVQLVPQPPSNILKFMPTIISATQERVQTQLE